MPPFLGLFCSALRDPLLLVLLFAAVVSGVVSLFAHTGVEEGVAVCTVAICIALTTATTDYLQIREFHNTIGQTELANCTVVRAQLETEIPVSELVVGDVVRIKTGMSVPADGILLEAFGLKTDESAVTGESDLVAKRAFAQEQEDGTPYLRAGTKVEEGTGSLLVCQVGSNSTSGQLRALGSQGDDHSTPLQAKLSHISNVAAVVGAVAATLVFVVLFIHIVWTAGKRKGWDATSWEEFTETLMTVVAILVVAVPEGLPLAVTLTLAYSVGKMKDQKNLVRHLRACETMGAVSEVCTDKTGTLTLNRMQVVASFYLDSVQINSDDREFNLSDLELQRLFMESFCLNSDASIIHDASGAVIHRGNRTDCALLALSLRWKCDYIQMRRKYPIVDRVPFSSKLKWMGTVVRVESGLRVLIKGAAEAILPKCTRIFDGCDTIRALTSSRSAKISKDVVAPFTSRPLRTILVAYKDVSTVDGKTFDSDFTLLGIFGIEDGIRPEVPNAVQSLQSAHITVRMVTGDSVNTAVAVAQQVGILQDTPSRYNVMEGNTFEEKVATVDGLHIRDLDVFASVTHELRVLARCSPTQKYLLICGLKALGSVVAVTGDGCNDAPALRQADVGFAMNIVGTEVAKEAADIILLDDNFASIVTAATWGRHTYDSIRRFIQFQLTASLSALILCVLGALTMSRSPLAPAQMLWVNLLVDSVAALALNAEPPADGVLMRPPHVRGESLLTADMKKTIVAGVTYQLAVLVGLLLVDFGDTDLHFTLVFHTFVLMQLVHEFCCRSLSEKDKNPCGRIWRNPTLLCVVVLSLLGQLCIIHFGG